jgi:hypothetical protein
MLFEKKARVHIMRTIAEQATAMLKEMAELSWPLDVVEEDIAQADVFAIRESAAAIKEYVDVYKDPKMALTKHLEDLQDSISSGMEILKNPLLLPNDQAVYIRRVAKQMEIYSRLYNLAIGNEY